MTDRYTSVDQHRLRLLEQVADTENEDGSYDPRRLLREAPDVRTRERIEDGLKDLQDAGLLVEKVGADFDSEPLTISPRGVSELQDLRQRRQNPAARNRACRVAVAQWLYTVQHSDRGPDGHWPHFIEQEGNDWYGQPYSERDLDRAAEWLYGKNYMKKGVRSFGHARPHDPELTTDGVSWVERGTPMDTDPSPGSSNVHITAAASAVVGVNNASPGASVAQTVAPSEDQRAAIIKAVEGLLEGLPACRLSLETENQARAAAEELRDLVQADRVDTTRVQGLYDRVKEAVLSGTGSKVGGLLVSGLHMALMVLFGLPGA